MSAKLATRQIFELADQLAALSVSHSVRAQDFLRALDLDVGAFNIDGIRQHVWRDILVAIHAGRSRDLGDGAAAVLAAVQAFVPNCPGNSPLQAHLHQLAVDVSREHCGSSAGACTEVGPVADRQSHWFISYSRSDRDAVLPLYEALVQLVGSEHVYLDNETTTIGAQWLELQEAHLARTTCLLCWVTAHSTRSVYTPWEVGVGATHGAQIVPLVADPTALATCAPWLSRHQGIVLTSPIDYQGLTCKLVRTTGARSV